MEYIFLFMNTALGLWLAFNCYQSVIAFWVWRREANPEHTASSFVSERLAFLGSTFVRTIVFAVITIGVTYILYEFWGMLFD